MMDTEIIRQTIRCGNAVLGIELGSTRIKAVLTGEDNMPIASGSSDWENRYENGVWTYRMEDVWSGIQESYRKLSDEVAQRYGIGIFSLRAIGFSAMMHGYLPFDKNGKQLAEFRTWRNTMTERAAAELSSLFEFNIPQRWSIAHLYQAMLNGEEHVKDIDLLTTLAGYVHTTLTGRRVLGIGEASGMMPIDSDSGKFDMNMTDKFDRLAADMGYNIKLSDILPDVLNAGDIAGYLTAEGARLIDTSGALQPGIPLCPPEGDAGTGMAATNSVAPHTGNVSAGTSVFAMIVLDKKLKGCYPEIDMVTTPSGKPVAMVHCNNCTSDINAWAQLLCDFAASQGADCTMHSTLDKLFYAAADGRADCGGLLSYNYLSGESITGLDGGRPLFVRMPDAEFTFENFARTLLYSSMATLKLGMDILLEKEGVEISSLMGHGGFFKAAEVGQRVLAAALNTPVSVMETAGEGGPWGMALLASYMASRQKGESLEDFLNRAVFKGGSGRTITPREEDVKGFSLYMNRYKAGLAVERCALESIK